MKTLRKQSELACASVLMLAFNAHGASGSLGAPASINTSITVNYVQPTCNVNVASTYDLGMLVQGPAKEHAELPVHIDCLQVPNMFTSLTALSSANTVNASPEKLQLMNENDKAWLSLIDYSSGSNVAVNFDNATRFCRAEQNTDVRTCNLKVLTQVESGNQGVGAFSVPVTFSIVYH